MHATATTGLVSVTLSIKGDSPLPELHADAMGQVTVGPGGLLGLLEMQLGIPSPDSSFTGRLIQYLGCIDQISQAGTFYHDSYDADPFSVARTLLQWRDQWYLAGWQGRFSEDAPDRLTDMAAIEELASRSVEPGLGQRIQRVIKLLPDNPVAIGAITLRDALTDFPYGWQQLINCIGAPVKELTQVTPQGREGTDLFHLQQHLLQNSKQKVHLDGDGSVIALRADSPQDSAPITALLSQSWLTEAPNKSIALLAEARGEILDDTLEQYSYPRLGFSGLSPWRPVFQVLPLACELLWEPLNPTALFQFLSHPVGPIPGRIRATLAQTVASTPGIGSKSWEDAISRSLESEDKETRSKLEEAIRYWLESPRFSLQDGVDSKTLSERAQKVHDWLLGARKSREDPAWKSLYNIALNQTQEFISAIERLKVHGRDPLTQDNVRRLIEDVRGTGAPITDRNAEVAAGQPRILRAEHAGAFGALLESAVDNVIWWDCQANDHVHRWPWSRTEREALAAHGVRLQTEDEQLQWLGKAWLRPVLAARERCTFVLHDDTERQHPTWDQIASLTEGLSILQVTGSDAAKQLGIAQYSLEPRTLPPKVRWWRLPKSVTLPQREAESFSSLDTYLHSPYQWLLRYGAKIRPGSLANVSDGSQLKGNLAHRLFENFLNTHPTTSGIDTGTIDDWVDTQIATLLEQEGAVLLEAGRQAERERFTTQLQASLTTLVEHLQSAGVVSVQMELWQEGKYAGGKLNGSIDILATRADGQEAVVDIKWGGKRYRRDSLLENSFLQLATYAQLRRNNGAELPPALSYFIVTDSHMLSLNHGFFPNAEIIKPEDEISPTAFWQQFENSWHWRKSQFDKGLIEVTVSDTELTADSTPNDDCLDIPEASDAFNDFSVLTGWGTNE